MGKTPGRLRLASRRFFRSILPAARFAPFYAAAVTGAVVLHMVWRAQAVTPRMIAVVILFALGGAIAGFLSWIMAATLAGARQGSARFAAMTGCLIVATAGVTGLLFLFQYRLYYAQWSFGDFSMMRFVYELIASLGALYIFGVSGLRMLLPFGLPVLFVAGLIFARRERG